jgi:hypothetical protein
VDESCSWWNGAALSNTRIALALFAFEPPQVLGRVTTKVLGVAADADRVVLLREDQIAPFLKAHAKATLVSWDTAAVHWTLHALFTAIGRSDAIQALWQFSHSARMIDRESWSCMSGVTQNQE